MDPVLLIAWIVAFVLVTVTVTGLVGRLNFSAPVALVVVGGVISYIPGVPPVHVEPDLILYAILPPLLFASAIRSSIVDIRARRDSILLLSVGLVTFTVIAVGFAAWLLLPALTLAAAFAFASVVAPTDAVAVSAIAGRVGLPRQVVTILEGESLLNDATALVALNTSIAAIVSVVNPVQIPLDFALAVGVGGGVGLGGAWLVSQVRRRLHSAVLDTSLVLIVPFALFLIAQELHGSGVIAVVAAGLYMSYVAPTVASAEARVATRLNWRTIQFLLENAVFLFIGLNLRGIVEGAVDSGPGFWPTVGIVAGILLALVVTRFAWVMTVTAIYRHGPARLRERRWSWGNGVVVSAASVRGVVTLAAVFLLPEQTPLREYLQLVAFVVVVVSLLGGLALPTLIRALKLPAPNGQQERTELKMLLAEARQAGIARLDEIVTPADEQRVVELLRADARFLGDTLDAYDQEQQRVQFETQQRLRRGMLAAQREAVLRARREGRYQEPAVLTALKAIDAEESSLRALEPEENG